MARFLALSLSVLVLFLCGCAPKDPLDRKVKASTPEEFAHWWDRTQAKFPDAQRAEIYKLARYLQDSIPRVRSMRADDHYDPLCKRINGLTVRQLMILAYEESSYNIRTRVILETGKLPHLVDAVADSADADRRDYAQNILTFTQERIASWKETISANERRIAELTAALPAP